MCVSNFMFINMASEDINVLDVIYGIEFDVNSSNADNTDLSNPEYEDVFKDLDLDCSSELSSLSNEEQDNSKSLEVHKRKHLVIGKHIEIIDGEQKRYKCKICKCQFSWKHQIRYHDYCVTGKRPLKCELCDKRFVKKSHLVYHSRTHSGESPFQCSICSKKFKQLCKLKRHEKIHQEPGEAVKFQCSVCEKKYCDQDSLKKHELKHDKSKTFQCKHCKKNYGNAFLLKQHMTTHQAPKFICEVCGRKFRLKNSLNIHLQMHEDHYPHQCPNCRKSFRTKKELKQHKVVHDESNPGFECSLCSVMFGRKDNLLRHVRNCHLDPCAKKDQSNKKISENLSTNELADISKLTDLNSIDNNEGSPAVTSGAALSLTDKFSETSEQNANCSSKTGLINKDSGEKMKKDKRLLRISKGKNQKDNKTEIKQLENSCSASNDTSGSTTVAGPSNIKAQVEVVENLRGGKIKTSVIAEVPVDLSKTEPFISGRCKNSELSSEFPKTSVIVHTSSLIGSVANSYREPVIKFGRPSLKPKSLVPDPT